MKKGAVVSKKEKYLASAQKLIERGQLDKALAEFAKVIEEDPKDTRTLLKMAELHAKRGANAEATEIYLRTGDLYADQGFSQKAVAVYKNALKLSPGTVPAHLKVGAMFAQLGLVSDAVQQFELASAALERAGKATEAVAALRQAADVQPENVVLRVKLAESASQAGLIDEAVAEFGRVADQLKAQGRLDESLRVMERLLFHQPGNFAKARELAEAYIAKGTPRLALPKLQAWLNGDPRDPSALSLLARALEQLDQGAKAVSVLKELMRLSEDLGRTSERDAAILRGLTLDPTDQDLRAAAARHQLRWAAGAAEATPPPIGVPGPAGAGGVGFDLSGAVRAPVTGVSGRVSVMVGDTGFSRPQGSGSTGTAPDGPRILAEAEVFVKYGLLERAANHLARVFDFAPEQREAREKLIVVLRRLGRHEDAARHSEILARQIGGASATGSGPSSSPHMISLNPDSGGVRGAFEAAPASGASSSLPLASAVAGDPAADVVTPPPERRSQDGEFGKEVMVSLGTEFDAEVRTGDVLLESLASLEPEIEISVEPVEPVEPGQPGQPGRYPQDGGPDGAYEQEGADTPPLVRRFTTLVPAGGPRGDQIDSNDGEDPAMAFSEDVATIVGDAELVATVLAESDEDELSAELEQVSFFIDQSMIDEARSALQDLEARFPRDPRIAAKLREVKSADVPPAVPASESASTARIFNSPTLGSTVIERPIRMDAPPRPRAVVSGGGISDSSTYADLAIAYKGMGLFDAAIAELKLLGEDPDREVFALTTMGECFEAKASFTEAIIRYKRALNCEQITPEEALVLYFLLGTAFEQLGDISEALYFFEKVLKRDSKFRDVDLKIAELKPRLIKRAR